VFTTQQLIQTLRYYEHLRASRPTRRQLRNAIRKFQRETRLLRVDGICGPKTTRAMLAPRCGCAPSLLRKIGRLTAKWNRFDLTYAIDKFVGDLPESDQRDIFRAAWDEWEAVCRVHVSRIDSVADANIVVSAARGAQFGFDGPGRTLAWAYLPDGNDQQLWMSFDLDELWTRRDSSGGIRLLNVAAHEFGHLLGLGHYSDQGALMSAFYDPEIGKPQVTFDIPQAQERYGEPELPPLQELTIKVTGGSVEVDGYDLVPTDA